MRYQGIAPRKNVGNIEEWAELCRMTAIMDRLLKRVVLIALASTFLAGGRCAASNPIGDFFKRLGNSIAHPSSTPPPRRNTKKNATGKKQNANNQTAPQGAAPIVPPVPPSPTATPTS